MWPVDGEWSWKQRGLGAQVQEIMYAEGRESFLLEGKAAYCLQGDRGTAQD